jgi:hypothetical protein
MALTARAFLDFMRSLRARTCDSSTSFSLLMASFLAEVVRKGTRCASEARVNKAGQRCTHASMGVWILNKPAAL